MSGMVIAGLGLIGLAAAMWLGSWLLERREDRQDMEDEEDWWWDQFG